MIHQGIVLIAKGYEWICPNCEMNNTTIELVEKVSCAYCDTTCVVMDYDHAY